MKTHPQYVITCDYAIVDGTGKSSGIGIFNEIYLDSVTKIAVHSFYILARFLIEDFDPKTDKEFEMDIVDKNDKSILQSKILVPVSPATETGKTLSFVIQVPNAQIITVGPHRLKINWGNGNLFEDELFKASLRINS